MKSLTNSTLIQMKRGMYKDSFYQFFKGAWPIIQEGYEFLDNWHIPIVCNTLQKTTTGEIKNLMIGMPPRTGKSLSVSMLVCWILAKWPHKKFLYVTSTSELASDYTKIIKKLMNSEWYKLYFPETILLTQQEQKLITSKGGIFQSMGVTTAITGKGCDYLLLDDLVSVTDSFSKTEIDKVNKIYDETLFSRLNSQKNGVKILIQQRLSTGDLTGHLLDREKDKWTQLVLPLLYDVQRYKSADPALCDPRKPGDILWKERFDQEVIDDLKMTLGERAFSAQYQQLPVPMIGGLFQRDWFKNRVNNTDVVMRFISADTASSVKDGAAYTSIIVGEITSEWKLFIRHVSRKRMTLPEQVQEIERLAKIYKFGLYRIVIEAKSTGTSIIQTIESGADEWITDMLVGFMPVADKVTRASQATLWCENGSVILPPQADSAYPWLAEFEEEFFSFPNTRYLDQTDSFSQLVIYTEHLLAEGLKART